MDATRFGHYHLLGLLGRGGMGEVYRAYDTTTDRVVALKLLPMVLAEDEAYKARFRREAHAAAQLNDPHIIPIHRFGEIGGRLYLDMRIVEGTDVDEILSALGGPLQPAQAVDLIRQVSSALDAAHRAGVVHRDIKPSNILVTDNGFAYLIDFGIARAVEQTALTGSGSMIGTFAYMAPERFRTGQVDPRSDIYALTCVLYECLTGTKAFAAVSTEQLITDHLFAPPPRPTALNSTLPIAFDDVVAKGLAKNPEDRYQTVLQLAQAVEAALSSGPAYPHQAATRSADGTAFHSALTQQRSAESSNAGTRRRGAMLAISIVLVLLTVSAITVWQVRRDDDPSSAETIPNADGTVRIGVKFDQPGLGLRGIDGAMSGFDVDVASYVAGKLGYATNQIEWTEAPSAQRENLIADGTVTFVVATYSITDERKKRVDFAGPYLDSGQALLARSSATDISSWDSLNANKLVCAVPGSTSATRVKDKYPGVRLQLYDTYALCIEALRAGIIDAVTTDAVILAGYAAQTPGTFKLLGPTGSEVSYGIGLAKGDSALRAQVNDALSAMEADGSWAKAFEKNFGPGGLPTPEPPPLDQ